MTRPAIRNHLALRITSDPANLAGVRREIEAFALDGGFDETARGQIVLCVNEALANITRHAYQNAIDQPIEIEADMSDERLRIRIRDWGSGRLPPRPVERHDPLQPGGVGLVCLRELMDSVTFEPLADGMLLTLERRRPGREGAAT